MNSRNHTTKPTMEAASSKQLTDEAGSGSEPGPRAIETVLTPDQLAALRDGAQGDGKKLMDPLVEGAQGRDAKCWVFNDGSIVISFDEDHTRQLLGLDKN